MEEIHSMVARKRYLNDFVTIFGYEIKFLKKYWNIAILQFVTTRGTCATSVTNLSMSLTQLKQCKWFADWILGRS